MRGHHPATQRHISRPRRKGVSLLEMILAIAILAGAMVILGELVRIGTRAGSGARDLTEAHLLCESIVSEIVCGAREPEPITRAEIPTYENWLYSIWLGATEVEGLVELRVKVEENRPDKKRPRNFTLVRWIADPGLELSEEPLEEGGEESAAEQQSDTADEPQDDSNQSGPGGNSGPANPGGPGGNQGPANEGNSGRN